MTDQEHDDLTVGLAEVHRRLEGIHDRMQLGSDRDRLSRTIDFLCLLLKAYGKTHEPPEVRLDAGSYCVRKLDEQETP